MPHDWVRPDGQVTTHDTVVAGVSAAYGATMLQVQTFEFSLAVLVGLTEVSGQAQTAEGRGLEDQLQEAIDQATRITQKITAGQAQRLLANRIDDDLLALIKPLVDWRNFLAHRYLRVRMAAGGSQLEATPQMFVELMGLALHFRDATKRITAQHSLFFDRMVQAEAPREVRAVLEELTRRIASQEPAPLPARPEPPHKEEP